MAKRRHDSRLALLELRKELQFLASFIRYCGTPRWCSRKGGYFVKAHSNSVKRMLHVADLLDRVLAGKYEGERLTEEGYRRLRIWAKDPRALT